MELIGKTTSTEPCAEAGWFAFYYHLNGEVSEPFIQALRPLGSFLFMKKLAKPFFKIESDYYMVKGLLHDDFFRVAVHKDHFEELERIEKFVRSILADLKN